MQDQPRLKYYRQSEFFNNEMGSRPLVEGTVPRGYLREDKALYTGKKDGAALSPNTLSANGGKQQTQDGTNGQLTAAPTSASTGASATNAATTYPDVVAEFPLPVTQELINRGEERYRVFCIVCHGPNGNGDGMIVRRGFSKPTSYHTDQLRGAPVGHFYDVITNGWGRMNGYAAQVPVYDRWAIVSYIRALQASQNPDVINPGATQQNQNASGNKTQAQVTETNNKAQSGGKTKLK
ncbi:MAG: cytochrome c [Pyrinomonadaceae bacterium]